MALIGYKKFIITLLLLAFTSQILATAAMTCELEKIAQTESVVISTNAETRVHAHHHMDEIPAHDISAMDYSDHSVQPHTHRQFDCCKTMGHCSLGSCSFAIANTSTEFLFFAFRSTAVDFYLSTAHSPFISSPYRPPISC
jgi:hypothetical protein